MAADRGETQKSNDSLVYRRSDDGRDTPVLPLAKRQALDLSLSRISYGFRNARLHSRVEQEVAALRLENERIKLQWETERGRFVKNLKEQERRIAELEKQRTFLYQEEQAARDKQHLIEAHYQELLRKVQDTLSDERQRRSELEEQLSELQRQSRRQSHELASLKDELTSKSDRYSRDREEFETIINLKDQQIHSKNEALADLEAKMLLKEEKAKVVENIQIHRIDTPLTLEKIHQLSVRNRRLERENHILMESSRNYKLIEERLMTAERRLEKYREIEQKYNELLANCGDIAPQVMRLQEGRETRQVIEVTAQLAKAQDRLGQVESQSKTWISELERLRQVLSRTEDELAHKIRQIELLSGQVKVKEEHESVFKTEISLLKEQIEAFERIAAVSHPEPFFSSSSTPQDQTTK